MFSVGKMFSHVPLCGKYLQDLTSRTVLIYHVLVKEKVFSAAGVAVAFFIRVVFRTRLWLVGHIKLDSKTLLRAV